MKKSLLFATGNENKVLEIRPLLPEKYEVITMGEAGFTEDIPETGSTLHENALLKARFLHEKTGKDVIAEDTGLEVQALEGAPGVHTARYAGEEKDPIRNMELLIKELDGKDDRSAQFRTVIALILEGREYTFQGKVEGRIATEMSGSEGFGYDPVFKPSGFDISFAEMDMSLKATMSHRARALRKLIEFLDDEV